MALIQLRNTVNGQKFTDEGGRNGEVLNVNESEVKVKVETGPGTKQYREERWAPGTEVQTVPQDTPADPATPPPSSHQTPQESPATPEVTRRAPRTPKAPAKGQKGPKKVTTTVSKPKSKPAKELGKKNAKAAPKAKTGGNGHKPKNGKGLGKKTSPKAPAKARSKDPVPQPKFKALQGLSRAGALRFLGSKGYTAAQARTAFDKLKIPVAQNTLVSQISSGSLHKTGGFQGDVPRLKKEQADALIATIDKALPKAK